MRTNGKIQLYPCLRLALFLMAGVVTGKATWPMIAWQAWAIGCAVTLVMAFLTRAKISQTCLAFLATALLGALVTSHELEDLRVDLPSGKIEYQAIVMSQPAEKRKTLTCDLLVTDGLGMRPRLIKATILKDTLTHHYQALRPGDGILAYGSVERPEPFGQESNFDYPLWMQAHGFVGRSFIYHDDWTRTAPDLRPLNMWQRTRVRAIKAREQLLRGLREKGIKGQEMAIVAAMALGEKAMLSQDTKSYYSATGVSHVLSLSGLHLGIIFQIIVLLTGRRRRRPLNTFCSLLAIWVYTVLVGMSASVIRSAVMITIYAFACLLHRNSMSVNSLSLAAIAMLLANPLCLYDISFQLSFMAVLSILVCQPMIYKLVKARWLMEHKVWRWLWALFTVSLAAQIGTQPLVTYYFGQVACYSLAANLVAVPMATVILYLSVITLITCPISFVCEPLANLLTGCVRTLNTILGTIATLPGSTLEGIHLSGLQLGLTYVALAALAMLYSKTSSIMKPSDTDVESLAQGSYPSGKSNSALGS